jgi:putative flippase GtrA
MKDLMLQAFKFALVGVANTIIGLLAIYGLVFFLGAGPITANAFGYAIGLTVSFTLNRLWTFQDQQSIQRVLPRYLAMAGVSYLLNLAAVLFFTHHSHVGPYVVQLFGVVVYTTVMFFGSRWFVFRASLLNREI